LLGRRNTSYVIVIIMGILLLPALKVHAAAILEDTTDDVKYYKNAALQGSGDYRNEIDFVSIKVKDTNIIATFQDTPRDDLIYEYYILITWGDNPIIDNFTVANLGLGLNQVATYLAKGTEVIADLSNEDTITIDGKTLIIPIPAYDLIQTIENPVKFYGSAMVLTTLIEYYIDEIDGIPTSVAPGYTNIITLVSLTILLFGITIVKKKKPSYLNMVGE